MKKRDPIQGTPIARAVAPLKDAAVESAEAAARLIIANWHRKLEACGWDAHAVAPYPSSKMSTGAYRTAERLYRQVRSITRHDYDATNAAVRADQSKRNACEIVRADATNEQRFVDEVRALAAATYEAYVWKLHEKIGTVETASITQLYGVWNHSHLTVEKAGGVTEVWYTQMILNHSVYGLPFNQFPTRKLKR